MHLRIGVHNTFVRISSRQQRSCFMQPGMMRNKHAEVSQELKAEP